MKLPPKQPTTTTWPQAAALAAIRLYQITLRPLNPWGCKLHPSCSHYASEAIERHGAARGGWLALKRLLRCRPGVRGGFDPVPDTDETASRAPELHRPVAT